MSEYELCEWWTHQLTWSDGRIERSRLRKSRPGQACFAGISQLVARKQDPGATVEHVVLARVEVTE
jgi:hypothetical protein